MAAKHRQKQRRQPNVRQDISQALLQAAQQQSIPAVEAVLLPHGGWLTRFEGLHVGTWIAIHWYPYTEDPGFKEEKRKTLEKKAKFVKAAMEMTCRYGKLKTFELFDAAIVMAGMAHTRGIDTSGGRWVARDLVREAKRYTLDDYLCQIPGRNLPSKTLGKLGITLIRAARELSQCLPGLDRRRGDQENNTWRMICAGADMMAKAGLGDIASMGEVVPGILPAQGIPTDHFWKRLAPGEAQQNLLLLLMIEALTTAKLSSNPAKGLVYMRFFEQGLEWLQAQPQLVPWDHEALMAYRGGTAGLDTDIRNQLQAVLLERLMLAKTPAAMATARKTARL